MGDRRRPPPADRPRLTSRAAVLAVVICAIALSLAYPVREYIAQVRQIDGLLAQRQAMLTQLRDLRGERQRLGNPGYVEQLAEDRLHFCLTGQTCYVVVGAGPRQSGQTRLVAGTSWYERLWHSVQQADRTKPQ
jgi:cell division protein FtsB